MTNEEAIKWLEAIRKKYIHGGDEGFDQKRNEALDLAISALERDRWISVEERLIHSGWYLVACNEWGGSAVRKAVFDEATGKWLEFPYGGAKDITKIVTHYRPLPESPKED